MPLLARLLGSYGPLRTTGTALNGVLLAIILAIAAVVVGIVAFKKSERSWMALVAFILAVAVFGFWVFLVPGAIYLAH